MKQIRYPKLSQKLKELRKAHSYKQADVAAALGIVRQTYSNYEQGIRTPSHEILYKLSGFYDISIDDLMRVSVELDPDIYYDAPSPTQTSEDLSEFIAFFNEPLNSKRFKQFSSLEKELLFYFNKIPDDDKKEVVAITKMKAHK